ncbi:MAG: succinate--CoA ligase subunit alpha [Syntrophobacteria bacterium]
MSILVDENTRLVVQGITGREGQFHTRQCVAYGTTVVAGVTPGKGGQVMDGIPVFSTVEKARRETGANASMIFVPPALAADAVMEAAAAGIAVIVAITEGIPVLDMMKAYHYLKGSGSRLIGPNCPGIISPGKCKVGIMPGPIHMQGTVGLISRSGTLTYEVVDQLTKNGVGQSTCMGIGGDPVIGTSFIDALELFEKDPETSGMVIVGEIGGSAEEDAAEYIVDDVNKPVIGFVAGLTAPAGRRMGHAGAIIDGSSGTAQAKIEAMEKAGITVVRNLGQLGTTARYVFGK